MSAKQGAKPEDWVAVCQKFNDDVSRVCDASDVQGYTGLFECFDDANTKFYYLVDEDQDLIRLKRKQFRENLGLD